MTPAEVNRHGDQHITTHANRNMSQLLNFKDESSNSLRHTVLHYWLDRNSQMRGCHDYREVQDAEART